MLGLNPYVNFDGNCREAVAFYESVFQVEASVMFFSEAPDPMPPEVANRVMHASLPMGASTLMASDTMPGMPFVVGNSVSLSLGFSSADEQTRVFEALSPGGKVIMPLEQQFFGRFGMLIDRFGVQWMLIHDENESK